MYCFVHPLSSCLLVVSEQRPGVQYSCKDKRGIRGREWFNRLQVVFSMEDFVLMSSD